MQKIIDIILDDIRIELTDEFDRNFERKAFFTKKWGETKKPNTRGSLMLRTSALRNSIQSSRDGFRLVWKSDRPYAEIHNEGGIINMTTHQITMPQRQFVGASPETDKIIGNIIDEHTHTSISDLFYKLIKQNDNG